MKHKPKCGVRSTEFNVPCGKFVGHDGPHEAFFANGSLSWPAILVS